MTLPCAWHLAMIYKESGLVAASSPVGARAHVAVLHVELVVVLAAQLARAAEAAADLHALHISVHAPRVLAQHAHVSNP